MSNTDPRRYDIPMGRAVTPGEGWAFSFTIYEEQEPQTDPPTFAEASSFSSYDNWAFYVFEDLSKAGGTAADRVRADKFAGGATVTPGTAPAVTVSATAAQTANVPPGTTRGWELWAEINGTPKRLRHGTIPVVH